MIEAGSGSPAVLFPFSLVFGGRYGLKPDDSQDNDGCANSGLVTSVQKLLLALYQGFDETDRNPICKSIRL